MDFQRRLLPRSVADRQLSEDVHSSCAKGRCLGSSNTHEAALGGICTIQHRSVRIHLRHHKGAARSLFNVQDV